MPKKKDLVGIVFSDLTVISEEFGKKEVTWNCLCLCGKYIHVTTGRLRSGNTKSCGCLKQRILKERNTTHGMSNLPEYQNWKDMLKRCFNKNNKRYELYAKKGITVYDEWVRDFKAFYDHIGSMPNSTETWTVGRKDNNLSYIPGNVQWESLKTQARNHAKQSNNTSGITGVQRQDKVINGRVYTSWVGVYTNEIGKKVTKYFSVNKYGEDTAKDLAISFREAGIEALKNFGIFYAESHGTDVEEIWQNK